MTMEEGLGMNKDRKRVDIREEYFVSLPTGCRASVAKEAGEGRERLERWETEERDGQITLELTARR